MSRQKVLWFIKGLGRGGAERLLEISIPYFNRKEFDYEVAFCLPHKNEVVPALEKANIPVFCLNLKSEYNPKVLYRLLRLVRERRPRILHLHLPYTGVLGRLAGRMAGVKNIVYTEHSIMGTYHPLSRLLNLLTYPLNHTTIAVSEEVQRSIMRHWLSRRTNHLVIANGIDLNTTGVSGDNLKKVREALGIPATHKVVGNVAHIRPEKGHEYLVRAAKLVVDRHPEVTFVIVGREKFNGEIRRLEDIAGSQGIKNNIIFTGFREDVAELMSTFDLFTLSSLSEGLPLALLEAMLLGKPAVATSVGGIPGVVKDGNNGFLVPPRRPEMLAGKILQLLQDDKLRATMSQRATRTVREQFNVQEMVRKVEEVYSAVLSRQ